MARVQEENVRGGRKNSLFRKSFLHKISNVFKKKGAKTPTLKALRQCRSTPKTRSASESKQQFRKRKRSSIGISSLSRSKISTPKNETGKQTQQRNDKNANASNSKRATVSPLMPRVLTSKKNIGNTSDQSTIVLDDTDSGIQIDDKAKPSESSSSPEVEILTVKITPNGTKKVKAPEKSKTKNLQKIISKFNSPKRLFRKDANYIPLTSGEIKSRRQTRNSSGYRFAFHNVYVPDEKSPVRRGTLRTIVIDGQNVGVEHAKAKGSLVIQGQKSSDGGAAPKFSAEGISICVDYFRKRGHKEIIAFVPQFRSKSWQCDKPEILERLNREGILKYTPCKQIDGRAYNSYDDRYVVQTAALEKGVIISNDNYRDLAMEDSKLKDVIDKRVLKFVWVRNTLIFSQDPLGRYGPTLDQILQH